MNKMALASICEAVLFGSLFASGVSAQQVSFLARRDFPVGSSPASVAVRDFNGDGVHSPWTATNTVGAPSGREAHTAVWTGSEMIVWGGFDRFGPFNTGGRYNPTTDSWIVTSTTDTPTARSHHAAVWSGSEMIVWGGAQLNTGGRYDPVTDTWIALSTERAPSAREDHTAVWTGTEMIVWGGSSEGYFNTGTGGRYDPETDTWTATSTVGAPSARDGHRAVWTGSEMIVWGGFDGFGAVNTGGRYNPTTDSWIVTSTTDTPTARSFPAVVWSGSEMIVWGGLSVTDLNLFNTGGRYNPTTDSWIATSTMDAPSPRFGPITVWTESEMIVWGGLELRDDPVPHTPTAINTGGRYDPATDSWLTTSMMDGPCPRFGPSAVWTESEMIVWGGSDTNTGGRYDPAADN